jgi:hypothetical protein
MVAHTAFESLAGQQPLTVTAATVTATTRLGYYALFQMLIDDTKAFNKIY